MHSILKFLLLLQPLQYSLIGMVQGDISFLEKMSSKNAPLELQEPYFLYKNDYKDMNQKDAEIYPFMSKPVQNLTKLERKDRSLSGRPTYLFVTELTTHKLLRLIKQENRFLVITGPSKLRKSYIADILIEDFKESYEGNVIRIRAHSSKSLIDDLTNLAVFLGVTPNRSLMSNIFDKLQDRMTLFIFEEASKNIFLDRLQDMGINKNISIVITSKCKSWDKNNYLVLSADFLTHDFNILQTEDSNLGSIVIDLRGADKPTGWFKKKMKNAPIHYNLPKSIKNKKIPKFKEEPKTFKPSLNNDDKSSEEIDILVDNSIPSQVYLNLPIDNSGETINRYIPLEDILGYRPPFNDESKYFNKDLEYFQKRSKAIPLDFITNTEEKDPDNENASLKFQKSIAPDQKDRTLSKKRHRRIKRGSLPDIKKLETEIADYPAIESTEMQNDDVSIIKRYIDEDFLAHYIPGQTFEADDETNLEEHMNKLRQHIKKYTDPNVRHEKIYNIYKKI